MPGRSLQIVALLMLLAACGPLPRPFQPEDKDALDLAAYARPAAILVLPLAEDAPGDPRGAAEAMATALRDHGLPAETRAAVAEHLLAGFARLERVTPDQEAVTIAWELREPNGTAVAEYRQRSLLPAGLWSRGQDGAVGSVMAEAAPSIAALKRRLSEAEAAAVAPPPERHLVIVPPETAPGDGEESLSRALTATLRAADVPVRDSPGDDDLLVMSEIEALPAGSGWQELRVSWLVVRARDRAELGRVDQQNRIPAGSLDGPWGATAFAIARGAAEGLIDLLNRLEAG